MLKSLYTLIIDSKDSEVIRIEREPFVPERDLMRP